MPAKFTRRTFLTISGSVVVTMPVSHWANAAVVNSPPKLYAYCIEEGVPGVKPRPLPEQIKLLRELGFAGLGFELPLDEARLASNLKELDAGGLQLFLCWTSLNVNPAQGGAFDARLPQVIRQLKGRPTTLSVLLTGLPAGDPQGMAPAVKALRALGDAAAEVGLRVSIYNHVNNWTESLPFVFSVVKQANHPQVGFNFNLCHWLKVEGARDYRPLLRDKAAKLVCVTLNGATIGASAWTNGLIRPLDEGDFNNRSLVRFLAETGYRGPVGLMCYGVPGEPREHLARSLKVWRSWHGGQ